jgi:F0F1-type ATP synthase membrane subunit b/b'
MPRRFLWAFLLAGVSLARAADTAKPEAATEDSILLWKIANFLIFAGGIGFVIYKFAPSFFDARSADIQKAIQEATGLKLTADLRYSEIDRKMANLSGEVGKLRAEAQMEMEREHERMIAQTKEEIAHIQKSTAEEIEALRGEGADRLRVHATYQALALAEARLRERFAATDQKDLVNEFLTLVERGKN